MAVLLGGLTILGVEAGPRMVTEQLPLTISIVWSLALANVFGTMLCFAMARPISRLTTMDANKLAPFLIVIISIGAYQSTQHRGDLLLLFGIGDFRWLLRIIDWLRIPFVIGFVLSTGDTRYPLT